MPVLLLLAAAAAGQTPLDAVIARKDREFVCPERLPDHATRMKVLNAFINDISDVDPKYTIGQLIDLRDVLLRKHKCVETLRQEGKKP